MNPNVRGLVYVIVCLNLITAIQPYRILGVFPFAARSHYFLGSTLLKGIAEAGHDVTFITPFSDEDFYKNATKGNWREIYLEGHAKILEDLTKVNNINAKSATQRLRTLGFLFGMHKFAAMIADKTFADPNVQKLIHSGEKFDAVIVTDFMMDSLKAFAYHFDANLITFSNHIGMTSGYRFTGAPALPSYFPNMFVGTPPKMTFLQRLLNMLMKVTMHTTQSLLSDPAQNEVIQRYFPNAPPLHEIGYNTSLALFNSHTSLNYALARVPVMVEIGGFHIKPPKPLPRDLQKVMDDAKHGVIYFSMGSHFKSEDLPPEAIEGILKVFSRRKETILWKWGQDDLPGKPDNVIIGKWFPQTDILAHPNLKLFITHGGFLSTTETVYHGVPVLCIPLMADQRMNAITSFYAGFARYILVEDLTEKKFEEELEEVISNPTYRQMAKERSLVLRDRRHTPLDEAVYWIEYVIRHKGAKHLRVAYADMPWYQYFLLDVIFSIIAVLVVIKKLIMFLVRKCRKDKTKLKKA